MKSAAELRGIILMLLDQVDYTRGACEVTEMVGAVLPRQVIEMAREACEIEAPKRVKK